MTTRYQQIDNNSADWMCQECTFENSSLLIACEVCGCRKNQLPAVNTSATSDRRLSALVYPVRITGPNGRTTIIRLPILISDFSDYRITPNIHTPTPLAPPASVFYGDPNEEFRPKNPPATKEQLSTLKVKTLDGPIETEKDKEKNSCSICMDNFEKNQTVLTTQCGHEFHDTCAHQWFAVTSTCPVCRHVLPDAEETTEKLTFWSRCRKEFSKICCC